MTRADPDSSPGQQAGRVAVDLLGRLAQDLPLSIAVTEECSAWLADRKIESLLFVDASETSHRQAVCDALWEVQRRCLREATDQIVASGVQPIVFKGAAFHAQFYGDLAVGQMSDVDLLVASEDLDTCRQCFSRLGYRQAVFDSDRRKLIPLSVDALRDEADHYELYPFMRLEPLAVEPRAGESYRYPVVETEGRLLAIVEFDLHHAVATNIPGDEFLERAVPGSDGAYFMSTADQLWFTTSRYYTEVATDGKRSLRDFAYLLPLLSSSTVDWGTVLAANERYLLYPSLFYYLSFMNRLGQGRLVPLHVLEAVSPEHGFRKRDWGWQLGVLFESIEPFPLDRQLAP